MNLAVRIQHHPSRAHLIPPLLTRLDGLDPVVIIDPGGPRLETWRSHRACLESIPDDATHLLCLQDDSLPCDGFADHALAAIEAKPDRVIALFLPGIGHVARQVLVARKRRERWLEMGASSFVPLVAVVYPAAVARAIPGYARRRRMDIGRADDAVVATYCRAHRVSAVATLPCLVEHRNDVPSAMRNGKTYATDDPRTLAVWFQQTPLAKAAT